MGYNIGKEMGYVGSLSCASALEELIIFTSWTLFKESASSRMSLQIRKSVSVLAENLLLLGPQFLIEGYLNSGIDTISSFVESAEIVAKVAFKMYLGVVANTIDWNTDKTEFRYGRERLKPTFMYTSNLVVV